jgi:hypothetical protein
VASDVKIANLLPVVAGWGIGKRDRFAGLLILFFQVASDVEIADLLPVVADTTP